MALFTVSVVFLAHVDFLIQKDFQKIEMIKLKNMIDKVSWGRDFHLEKPRPGAFSSG